MTFKQSIVLILLFISTNIFAQLIDDNSFRSYNNPHYWENRKPFEGYWQQDVHYKIKATIDEKTNQINAIENLTYWNNSPDTLAFVYFHLYQNAFTKGSYLEELHKVNHQPIKKMGAYQSKGLGTQIDNFKVEGVACELEYDNTILKVTLPKPLYPNKSVKFAMTFTTYFDRGDFRRRMALNSSYGSKAFNGVHWYPRISVYDIKKGWDCDQHLNKELYGDYGVFDVELNFASNYVVEATGELQNPEEVYPGNLRSKLDIKNFINKPWNEAPSIITPYDSTKRKSWRYHADNVHDFAFTANPHYRISEDTWNGVKCIAVVQEPHASGWKNCTSYMKQIIKIYSEDFGMFDYPKIVAADADDGMEYPMITLDGGADPDYRGLLAHEIGHNWFYGMIGNNETYRASLDEGFTQFITSWFLEKNDGKYMVENADKNKYKRKHRLPKLVKDRNVYNRYMNDAMRGDDKMLNTHSNDFHSALGHENGYSNVYHKTATMLYNLQYTLGDELFIKAMQHYVAKWKFCHPYFEDFRQSIIEYTHTDLNWFFDQWMETTKTTDYAIKKAKSVSGVNNFEVTFKRKGQMQMPVDFTVVANDKKKYDFHIPNNNYFTKKTTATVLPKWYGWDLLNETYKANVTIPSGINTIQIDTSNRLADVNMMNNYYKKHNPFFSKKMNVSFDNYIQNGNDWKKYNLYYRPDIWWNNVDGIKLGLNINGSQFGIAKKLYATVWLNTHIAQKYDYKIYEGESYYKRHPMLDYTFRYETPIANINKKINVGVDSRMLEGLTRHNVYSTITLNDKSNFRIDAVSMNRRGSEMSSIKQHSNDYLFYKQEWSSTSKQRNAFLQMTYNHTLKIKESNGSYKITMRAPLSMSWSGENYNYTYLQGEMLNNVAYKKLDIKTRAFVRLGTGKNMPTESVLYLSGANPEEMMENKFTRSHGFIPEAVGDYSTSGFSALHAGGGLNLRGYTGYYAIDAANNQLFLNYKGQSGGALNVEIEFDKYIKLKPKYLRDYLHVDAYLFGDAGVMGRSMFDFNTINVLKDVDGGWSKLRTDAGIGFAFTIKKFGPLEKAQPFVIRTDFPLFISAPPFLNDKYSKFRAVIGVARAF
jgi:aminopeptidase N